MKHLFKILFLPLLVIIFYLGDTIGIPIYNRFLIDFLLELGFSWYDANLLNLLINPLLLFLLVLLWYFFTLKVKRTLQYYFVWCIIFYCFIILLNSILYDLHWYKIDFKYDSNIGALWLIFTVIEIGVALLFASWSDFLSRKNRLQ